MKQAVAILLFLVMMPAQAGERLLNQWSDWWLLNDCLPVTLAVDLFIEDAEESELTKGQIRIIAESRLRAAGLYSDDASLSDLPFLHVIIDNLGNDYSVDVKFSASRSKIVERLPHLKELEFEMADAGVSAVKYGGTAEFVMQSLSEQIDFFIDEYLRVNAKDC